MESLYDTSRAWRRQELYVGLFAAAAIVASTLDPAGMRLNEPARVILLAAGVAGVAWILYRLLGAGDLGSRRRMPVILCVLAIHLLATFYFFPVGDIANGRPVLNLDHPFHHYQAARANAVFLQTGRLHCYDPYYMAGYPTALFDLDLKGAELFCAVLPAPAVPRALKLFILLSYVTLVVSLYKGSRYLGLTWNEALLATGVALAYWHWGRPYASHFRVAGMFEFILASHLAVLLVGLMRRFLEGRNIVSFFVVGSVTFFIHPTVILMLPVPFVVAAATHWRELSARRFIVFLLWCLVVVVVNGVWVLPLLSYLGIKTPSTTYFQIHGVGELLRLLSRPGSVVALGVIALAAFGAWTLLRARRIADALIPLSAALFLGCIATFGAFIPWIQDTEPGRFLVTTLFFLCPLAGVGCHALVVSIGAALRHRPRLAWVPRALVVALLVSPLVLSFLSARTKYRQRLRTAPGPEVARLIEAVKSHTDRSGRLMIEDGPAALYGGAHIPGVLALYTNVEQIGGPYPHTFLEHHFATFQADHTFGRDLSQLETRSLWSYINAYNVAWVLTASAAGRECVEALGTAVHPLWRSRRYTLWRVERPRRFAEPAGVTVNAGYNRIDVRLDEPMEVVTLKYHWDKGLKVHSPARLGSVYTMDDPVPHIRLEPNGATKVVITY